MSDEDELRQLREWKAEAIEVLTDWEAVWEALGSPGRLGASKANATLIECMNLRGRIRQLEDEMFYAAECVTAQALEHTPKAIGKNRRDSFNRIATRCLMVAEGQEVEWKRGVKGARDEARRRWEAARHNY